MTTTGTERQRIEERMSGLFRILSNLIIENSFCREEEKEWYRDEISRVDEEYESLKKIYYNL